MGICDEINAARDCGVIHCRIIEIEPMRLDELASKFGLILPSGTCREINRDQAEAVVKRVLYCDLAYGVKIMSETTAQVWASRFLDCFDEENTQYYTNGDFYSSGDYGWYAATDATFDTGVVVITKSRSGCLWVEDED